MAINITKLHHHYSVNYIVLHHRYAHLHDGVEYLEDVVLERYRGQRGVGQDLNHALVEQRQNGLHGLDELSPRGEEGGGRGGWGGEEGGGEGKC